MTSTEIHWPSRLSTDEELLRLFSLDIIGTLQTVGKIEQFNKIDQLLEHQAYVSS